MTKHRIDTCIYRESLEHSLIHVVILSFVVLAVITIYGLSDLKLLIEDLSSNGQLDRFYPVELLTRTVIFLVLISIPIAIWFRTIVIEVRNDGIYVKRNRNGKFDKLSLHGLNAISAKKCIGMVILINLHMDEQKVKKYLFTGGFLFRSFIQVVLLEYNDGSSVIIESNDPQKLNDVIKQISDSNPASH